MAALWQFVRERFPLSSHGPMVAVFTLGNAALVADAAGVPPAPARLLAVAAIALAYFLRLRCFDEIKDHEVDLRENPQRPLARGLVTRRDLGLVIAVALVLELALAAVLAGGTGVLVHAAAQGYSFLMYREFFVGRWLRPRLTTYAVTHTFSAVLLGTSLGMLNASLPPRALTPRLLLALLANWCLFNLFEFARKTWAPAEERPKVDSYSRRFGVGGAVLLAWTQVAGGLLLLGLGAGGRGWPLWLQGGAALLPLAGGVLLLVRRSPAAAGAYRGLVSAYLVLFYVVLAAGHLAGRLRG